MYDAMYSTDHVQHIFGQSWRNDSHKELDFVLNGIGSRGDTDW